MSKKILFIEDEPSLQKAIGSFLEDKGYEVKNALDGETGLAAAYSDKPDLILLDLVLPKKDGFEVLKELKEKEETASIPVIILTNLESGKDIEKALSLGASTYLVKANYELEDIAEKVENALRE